HILHLIEDASVPDHTRNDTHADLFGDPGSPYEDYSKEHTNFNALTVAENLRGGDLLNFTIIQDAFEYLAGYSNNNFFSEDTISNVEYNLPNLKELQNKDGYLYDEKKKIYLAKIYKQVYKDAYSTSDNAMVLPSYFSNLSSHAVLTGASVLDLFFREVKKYKNNPELLPNIIEDSNEAVLSYLKKSPRLVAVNAVNFVDKAGTNAKIYLAKLSSFSANFLPAQLSGLISTNAQPQGQVMIQSQQQPLSQPALQPTPLPLITPQLQNGVVVDPIAYEVPIVPAIETTTTQNIAQDISTVPLAIPPVEVVESPAIVSEVAIDAPMYHGSGSVTGVSPDAVAVLPPAEESLTPLSFSETSTTTDATATSTDNTATSTEEVIATATSTEPVIVEKPEIIDGAPIVINEIAWMGTKAQANDEWIELYNKTNADIDLSGWTLESKNKQPNIILAGVIPARGYFLLERTASTTTDQIENMVYTGALNNAGPDANLYLKNGTTTVDFVGYGSNWFAGDNGTRRTMERVSPYAMSTNSYNWKTYSDALTTPFAKDAKSGDILGTPGAKNSVTGYYTPTGNITEDTVWRKAYSPYYVPPFMMEVQTGATLTIEPGVVVKFAKGAPYGGGMEVRGVLRAEGTVVEPIVFTSFLDDAVDGVDSNQDGSLSSPSSADWMNVNFYNSAPSSVVRYARVFYGGQGVSNNPNGWYPKYTGAFSVHGAHPQITDSIFERNHAISLYVEKGAHPLLERNMIKNTAFASQASAWMSGFGVRIADASSTADIIGNIFEDNTIGISSESATSTPLIVKDNTFTRNQKNAEFNYSYGDLNLENTNNQDSERKGGLYIQLVVRDGQVKTLRADTMPYVFRGGITVAEGGILTIEPGAVIKSASNPQASSVPVVIRGTLKAQGTEVRPIIFTAFADDSDGYDSDGAAGAPTSGAWENIQFLGATSSNSILEYVQVRYGGLGKNLCPHAYLGGPCMDYKGAMLIQDASPTISRATFDKNLAIAVYVAGDAQPIIEYSDIHDTKQAIKNPTTSIGGIGISIGAESLPALTDNTFTNNLEDVVYRP
ncbi:MAG: lamin tail domain-containing protein, partial [Patescibacteria group bacterium]